jgi:hypothetical protein
MTLPDGQVLYFRALSWGEMSELREMYFRRNEGEEQKGEAEFAIALIVATACDEACAPAFTAEAGELLRREERGVVAAMFQAALRASGMGAIEDAEKNSASAPSDDSNSALH